MPKTKSGKWSLGLIVAMPILFFIGSSFTNTLYKTVPSGDTILNDIAGRPVLALTMLAGMTCGVLAFVTGLVAIIKQKDHSIHVYAATIIGALLIIFLACEVIFPH